VVAASSGAKQLLTAQNVTQELFLGAFAAAAPA
jgi:hypothetical protein